MSTTRPFSATLIGILLAVAPNAEAAPVSFTEHVQPIFDRACVKCHGPKRAKGGLRLDDANGVRAGGLSELLVPGNAAKSYLVARLLGQNGESRMPEEDEAPPLPTKDVALIAQWINEGAVLPAAAVAAWAPPPLGVRRLTRSQYVNTVADVLGVAINPTVEADTKINALTSVGAYTTPVSLWGVELYAETAASTATAYASARRSAAKCTSNARRKACEQALLRELAGVLFRSGAPVLSDEALWQPYKKIYDAAGAGDLAFALTLSAILQSPRFLYLEERAVEPLHAHGDVPYDAVTLVTKLALLLWDSAPDGRLLARARQLDVTNEAQVIELAGIMLDDERAKRGLHRFIAELFDLDLLEGFTKDPKLYPSATPELGKAMTKEIELLADHIVFTNPGDFFRIYSAPFAFVNRDLAAIYELPFDENANLEWQRAPLDRGRRGILGTAGFLASTSIATRPSPTLRGVFIREHLLCQDVPAPPDNVNTELPEEDAAASSKTMRQKLAAHVANQTCAACHRFFDPLGLALESFDALGAFRTHENNIAIDLQGTVDGQSVSSLADVQAFVSKSPRANSCLVRTAYQHAVGRRVGPPDEPRLSSLTEQFVKDGRDLRRLLLAIVKDLGFRFAHVSEPSGLAQGCTSCGN